MMFRMSGLILATAVAALVAFPLADAASCTSFSASNDVTQLCAGVVDYEFYLPTGYTLSTLNDLAIAEVNDTALAALPTSCLADLKKLVCASVYLKCVDGVDLTDVATYQPINYNGTWTALPFQRPCESLCEATTYLGTTCAGLLELFGAAPTCDRFDDAISLPAYDDSSATCNALTNVSVQVQGTSEPYLYTDSGSCAGGLSTIYVPSAQLVSSSLAPLQAPYVVQTILEETLASSFADLPAYLSQECISAAKNMFCATAFMSPESVPVLAAYLPDLRVPQYPARELCEAYRAECPLLVEQGGTLDVDCEALSSTGLIQYPEDTQTLSTITLGATTITLTSDPNEMTNSTIGEDHEPLCPDGFVIPDEPGNARVKWVTGTACAIACPFPFYTEDEWQDLLLTQQGLVGISIVGVAVTLLCFVILPEKRRAMPLITVFVALDLVKIVAIAGNELGAEDFGDQVCTTNASGTSQSSLSHGESCAVTSLVTIFCTRIMFALWTATAVDLYLRVVRSLKGTERYVPYYLATAIAWGLAHWALLMGMDMLGSGDGHIACYINANPLYYQVFMILPETICILVGVFCMVSVVAHMVQIVNRGAQSTGGGLAKKMKYFRTPVLFVVALCFVQVVTYTYEIVLQVKHHSYKHSIQDWSECVFTNFNENGDDHFDECGTHPESRPPYAMAHVVSFVLQGSGIILPLVFLNMEVLKQCASKLGLCNVKVAPPESRLSSSTRRKSSVVQVKVTAKVAPEGNVDAKDDGSASGQNAC